MTPHFPKFGVSVRSPQGNDIPADGKSAQKRPADEPREIERGAAKRSKLLASPADKGAGELQQALPKPGVPDAAKERFSAHFESSLLEPSSGKSYSSLLGLQAEKGRPLLIAKCLCPAHKSSSLKNSRFLHPEFIEGSIAFAVLRATADERSKRIFPGPKVTKDVEKKVLDFIARDFEFWAVNPNTKEHDVIADRTAVIKDEIEMDLARQAILFCDPLGLEEEEADDQAFAYLTAALYLLGRNVTKDEGLAHKSVERI